MSRAFSVEQDAASTDPSQPASSTATVAPPPPPVIPAAVLQHNADLVEGLRGKLILAPLTRQALQMLVNVLGLDKVLLAQD